ncbi:MAG TPA: gamma-glutamyltransferase, partial [Pseudomonadales bacterium]|nr:gamma-glutamyltransferase [Pseudomonadales bacterium]
QHHLASDVGATILRQGGNAIDAAVATGLALGTVEPWMSGIGGGGYMTVYLAREDVVKVVEFGMRSPFAADPGDYPLAPDGENTSDAFNWPKVAGDTNVEGPLSIAVPGYVKGTALALEHFGTMRWDEVIEPACMLAEWGLPLDWYSVQKITGFARPLARYEETRKTYLADGLPPQLDIEGSVQGLRLGNLAQTYRALQQGGASSFYRGELAAKIAADLAAAGSRITPEDLAQYEARITDPLTLDYRDATVNVAGHLTAGPSIAQALTILAGKLAPHRQTPGVEAYTAYAESLLETYEYRLSHLGEGPEQPTNTSHICVADRAGNVVSLTQTIMSGFGSRIMLPGTGILMNNGMMWFDPRPGGPNSVVGGRHPLCNMCPTIVRRDNGGMFAAGACGGRKIFPAIFQLVSFMVDYGMTVNEAVHQARIDNSGTAMITAMSHIDPEVYAALAEEFSETRLRPNGVSPNFFALPQMVNRNRDGKIEGACFIPSPHAKVSIA